MIGKLVQLNSEYFEGNMNEHGCGLIVSDPRPRPRPRHLHLRPRHLHLRPPHPHLRPRLPLRLRLRLRPRPRPSADWVEVLWSDGKTYWEYVDYLKEISEE